MTGVPSDDVVTRTARVRVAGGSGVARTARGRAAGETVALCVVLPLKLRTARAWPLVAGCVAVLLLVIPPAPRALTAGEVACAVVAAAGAVAVTDAEAVAGAPPVPIMRLPTARDDDAVLAAVVAVVPVERLDLDAIVPLPATVTAGFAATVGDGTAADETVGVSVPVVLLPVAPGPAANAPVVSVLAVFVGVAMVVGVAKIGAAAAAALTAFGAAAVFTAAARRLLVVTPLFADVAVFAAVIGLAVTAPLTFVGALVNAAPDVTAPPPLTIATPPPSPAPLVMAGFGPEKMVEFTVSGFPRTALTSRTCPVGGSAWPAYGSRPSGFTVPSTRPRKPSRAATVASASTAGVVIDAGPAEIIGTVPPDVPFVGAGTAGLESGWEVGCPLPGILLVVQPKTANAAASAVLASKPCRFMVFRIWPPVFSQRVATGY
jgi:hypothetical protein